MTNGELRYKLAGADQSAAFNLAEHVEATDARAPFWRTAACSALGIAKAFVKLNKEQAAAWNIVQALLCGADE